MGLSVACNFLLKLSKADVRIADRYDQMMASFTDFPLSSLGKEFAHEFSTLFVLVEPR